MLADELSPSFLAGAFQLAFGYAHSARHVLGAFRSGEGMAYDHQDPDVFTGVARFYLPAYTANLTSTWIPALTGMLEKLQAGARIADVGCGHGVSTLLLAQTYPTCEVVGFDYHAGSITRAQERARVAGIGRYGALRGRGRVSSFPGATISSCSWTVSMTWAIPRRRAGHPRSPRTGRHPTARRAPGG